MSESVFLWSKTAASNSNSDASINWAEGQAPSSVNNSARSMMAAIACFRDDIGGQIVSTGSTNEYTLTTNQGLAAHANGVMVVFRADKTNTGAATTTIDGLAQKSILRANGDATAAGDIVSGGIYVLRYSSVAGHYLATNINPGTNTVTAAATMTDNAVLRGDGGSRGAQTSVVLLDDTTGTLYLTTSDSGALGKTSAMWSDLFLASGAVINFNAGDVTITHSSNALAIGGGAVSVTGGAFSETVVALSDGATPALDASLGNVFYLDAGGNRTIAVPSNATSGQKIVIRHFANGAARTLALNTGAGGFRFGTNITALTETESGKMDYIGAIYNSVDSFWDVVAYAKGY